jgi:hypothetical protein
MVRKRCEFMCPLNRVFDIFGLCAIFHAVAVQEKASNTTKDANTPQFVHFCYTFATLSVPTPLVTKNAAHLVHFGYTLATLSLNHTLATLSVPKL